MTFVQKIKNPIIWILGLIVKLALRKLFFSNISNDDFKKLLSYTLELLPNETFINIIKLFFSTFIAKPSNLLDAGVLNEAVTHSIPTEQRVDILSRLKFLFIFLILSNILKRTLFLFKSLILLPFRLGVYSFIASLFGFRPDYILSFFYIFKFNLPSWTYNKLLELHLSWMTWFKNNLQIKSITTESYSSEKPFPKLKSIFTNPEPEIESKPETYLYLTKTQWFYLSITLAALLAAYFGYTGGIPFKKSFEWESDDSSSSGDLNIPMETRGSRRRAALDSLYAAEPNPTWYDTIKTWPGKLNPFNWWTGRTETPQILVHPQLPVPQIPTDPVEREAYLSERLSRKFVDIFYSRPEEQEQQSKWKFFSKWWTSDNDTDFIRQEQLERRGGLNPIDRDELRAEYQASKTSSPVHPDPDSAREFNRLFPKPDSSTTTNNERPTSPIWMRDNTQASGSGTSAQEPIYKSGSFAKFTSHDNDSTDTVTQDNFRTTNENNNLPSDITASEFTPLTTPDSPSSDGGLHTYPPRFSGLSALADTPFARGFKDDTDVSEIRKGKKSLMFHSRFLSNPGKNKDDFNGDWEDM